LPKGKKRENHGNNVFWGREKKRGKNGQQIGKAKTEEKEKGKMLFHVGLREERARTYFSSRRRRLARQKAIDGKRREEKKVLRSIIAGKRKFRLGGGWGRRGNAATESGGEGEGP